MSGDPNKKAEDPEDRETKILSFLFKCVNISLRIKQEKWQKLMSGEEKVTKNPTFSYKIDTEKFPFQFQTMVLSWINKAELMRLCFYNNTSGHFTAFLDFPSNSKGKIMYFVKKNAAPLIGEDIRSVSEISFFGENSGEKFH